jgi:hypothetical protein
MRRTLGNRACKVEERLKGAQKPVRLAWLTTQLREEMNEHKRLDESTKTSG